MEFTTPETIVAMIVCTESGVPVALVLANVFTVKLWLTPADALTSTVQMVPFVPEVQPGDVGVSGTTVVTLFPWANESEFVAGEMKSGRRRAADALALALGITIRSATVAFT
jgi:hypothetical protein